MQFFEDLTNKENEIYSCNECGEEFEEKDLIYFKNSDVHLCKNCIDEVYAGKEIIKEKIVVKNIEKPIIKYVDKNNGEETIIRKKSFLDKSRFD